jgi:hypothetical protein
MVPDARSYAEEAFRDGPLPGIHRQATVAMLGNVGFLAGTFVTGGVLQLIRSASSLTRGAGLSKGNFHWY